MSDIMKAGKGITVVRGKSFGQNTTDKGNRSRIIPIEEIEAKKEAEAAITAEAPAKPIEVAAAKPVIKKVVAKKPAKKAAKKAKKK